MRSKPLGRWLLWLVIVAVLLVATVRYVLGQTFYGEYLHWTGEMATHLLIITVAVTPFRLLFPRTAFTQWLVRHRRDLGLATFLFAAAHMLVYLVKLVDPGRIGSEALEIGMLTGWIAMLVFLALALTSNNRAMRALGRRWKKLHYAIYLGIALTFAHWILTAFDPAHGFLHLGIVLSLIVLRLFLEFRRKSAQ